MTYRLTWMPDVLLAAGLKIAESEGWRTRGRSEMGHVRGVMCHHTANPKPGNMPTLRMLERGRPDLAGPLCNLGLGRDGTFYIIAAGRANHAGKGRWEGIATGNSSFIGIEAEHSGDPDDPWPEVQMDAYRRGVAALLRHIGAGAGMCVGHKEYALPVGRKPDPCFDMAPFRNEVADFIQGKSPPAPIPAVAKSGHPTIRRGDEGPEVEQMQERIRVPADGIFGRQTEAALREWQRGAGLVGDGICGPRTWASLLDPAAAAVAAAAPPPVAGDGAMTISPAGIALIHSFESCAERTPDGRFVAYPDPGSKTGRPWTIGWGSTGSDIREGVVMSQAECDARFAHDIQRYVRDVRQAIGDAPTSQQQFDALVSFHYNTGAIAKATLTQRHRAGDFDGAVREFARWVRNDGKVMKGLVRRRKAEADLYSRRADLAPVEREQHAA